MASSSLPEVNFLMLHLRVEIWAMIDVILLLMLVYQYLVINTWPHINIVGGINSGRVYKFCAEVEKFCVAFWLQLIWVKHTIFWILSMLWGKMFIEALTKCQSLTVNPRMCLLSSPISPPSCKAGLVASLLANQLTAAIIPRLDQLASKVAFAHLACIMKQLSQQWYCLCYSQF